MLHISFGPYFVFRCDLRRQCFSYPHKEHVVAVTHAEAPYFSSLVAFWANHYRPESTPHSGEMELRRLFSLGDRCYCVVRNHDVVAMTWVGFASSDLIKRAAACLVLGSNGAILQKVLVAEKQRGGGLHHVLASEIRLHLKEEGVFDIYAIVGCRNIASIMSHSRQYSAYKPYVYVGLRFWRMQANFFPSFARTPWIELGRLGKNHLDS